MNYILSEEKNTVIDEEFFSRQQVLKEMSEVKEPQILLPLKRDSIAPAKFPFEALGPILGPPAKRIHEIVMAPDSICGNSMLAVAALLTQRFADIYIDGRVYPLSLFILTVAESGDRKSAVEKIALKSIQSFEKARFKDYSHQREAYKNALDIWKIQRSNILKKSDPMEIQSQFYQLGNEPAAPLLPNLLLEEPTYEGLIKLFAIGQPSIGLFSDEGGRMFGGHGMKKEEQLKTACGLSNLWDAKNITRIRSADDNLNLYGRRFSAHLMMQEVVLSEIQKSNILMEQGIMARCLIAFPNSNAGSRPYNPIDITNDRTIQEYYENINKLLDCPCPLSDEDIPNELNPRELSLSSKAKELWIKFHDEVDLGLGVEGPYFPIRRMANKAAEQALRIAGILTLVEDVEAATIDANHLEMGITLIRFYISEALRISEMAFNHPDLDLAEDLLKWMKKKVQEQGEDKIFTLQEIYQKGGPRKIREAKVARRILDILESHNRILSVQPKGWRVVG